MFALKTDCTHPSEFVVVDDHENTQVCTKCSYVIDDNISIYPEYNFNNKGLNVDIKSEIPEILRDVCDRMCLSEHFIYETWKFYKKYFTNIHTRLNITSEPYVRKKKRTSSAPLRYRHVCRRSGNICLAYSLYRTLLLNDILLHPTEICYQFGLKGIKCLQHVGRYIKDPVCANIRISTFCFQYMNRLEVPYRYKDVFRRVCESIEVISPLKPHTSSALVLYLSVCVLSNNILKKKRQAKICNVTGISRSYIKLLCKKNSKLVKTIVESILSHRSHFTNFNMCC